MPSAAKRKKTKERAAARDSVARALQQNYPAWAAENVHTVDNGREKPSCETITDSAESWTDLLLATTRPCSQADALSLTRKFQQLALDCQVSFDATVCCIFVRSRQANLEQVMTLFQGLVDDDFSGHDKSPAQHVAGDLHLLGALDTEIDDFSFW